MLGALARVSNKLGRNVMTNVVRNHSHGGVPGEVSTEFKIPTTTLHNKTAHSFVFIN